MMWNGRRVKAYAYTAPVDMRKGFDGLMAVVEQKLRGISLNEVDRVENGEVACARVGSW